MASSILFPTFHPVYLASAISLKIGHQTIVFAIHERRGDHEISRSPIAGNRNIPYHGHAQEGLDVGIMRQGFERIPEKDQKIDFAIDNLGADLLITAQRAALAA